MKSLDDTPYIRLDKGVLCIGESYYIDVGYIKNSKLRYLGYIQDWYDHPLSSVGFWFFAMHWFLPWTKHKGRNDFMIIKRRKL